MTRLFDLTISQLVVRVTPDANAHLKCTVEVLRGHEAHAQLHAGPIAALRRREFAVANARCGGTVPQPRGAWRR